jgi:hypothetical protein
VKRIILVSLVSGFLINLCDVTITVTTVATAWNAELARQGITPTPFTPPYYVSVSSQAGDRHLLGTGGTDEKAKVGCSSRHRITRAVGPWTLGPKIEKAFTR